MRKLILLVLGICICNFSLYADKLTDIKKKGVLTVGIENSFEPFSFKSRSGKMIGFNIDLAEFVAKELGVKLNFKNIKSNTLEKNILNNNVDIVIAPILHTKKLDKKLDFSISYFFNGQTFLIGKKDKSKTYKDFASKKVAAVSTKRGNTLKKIEPLSEIVYYSNLSKALKALKSKKVAGITANYASLSRLAAKNKTKVNLIGNPFTVEPYGIILKENQSNLRDKLNNIIQKTIKDGYYDEIYKKWFNRGPFKQPTLWP